MQLGRKYHKRTKALTINPPCHYFIRLASVPLTPRMVCFPKVLKQITYGDYTNNMSLHMQYGIIQGEPPPTYPKKLILRTPLERGSGGSRIDRKGGIPQQVERRGSSPGKFVIK